MAQGDNSQKPLKEGKYFWHYTDAEGAKGIMNSGSIRPSTDSTYDATYGKGHYFTDKGPSNKSKELLANNYDSQDRPKGSVQYGIGIKKNQLPNIEKCPAGERDVYLNEDDEDLKLPKGSVLVKRF